MNCPNCNGNLLLIMTEEKIYEPNSEGIIDGDFVHAKYTRRMTGEYLRCSMCKKNHPFRLSHTKDFSGLVIELT